jgi:16S rRNA (guanine527-N7)-methyltransferase
MPWKSIFASHPFAGVLWRREVDLLAAGAEEWGVTLSPEQVQAFAVYQRELILWNERINLTTVKDPEEVQVKHFLDSLSCLRIVDTFSPDARCIDIGTGAGFPGLPLKIVRPSMRLTLLESVGKKARFLEHMVKTLGLRDVDVVHGRAEELGRHAEYREMFDVALARAVAQMAVLVEYALPLLRIGGIFVAQKGAEVGEEVEAAQPAMRLLGGRLQELRAVSLPGIGGPRHLVVVEKVDSTPERYPRRAGIPTKRPLLEA